MVLKGIDYKKLSVADFDPETLTKDNINELLGISNENYENVSIYIEDNIPEITIIGKGKWEGLIACGTSKEMLVVRSVSDCNTDMIPPVITILGDNPFNMYAGETYSDAGATATAYSDAGATALDDADGNVTSKITTTGTVNTSVVGTYTITYTVKDTSGNTSVATRTVNVVDTTKPTIAFGTNGNSTYVKTRSTTVTVSDNVGVNTSSLKYLWNTSATPPSAASIITSFTNGGTINTPVGVTGDYYLWILAKDTTGNTTISGSNVFKLDNTKPVITVTGTNPITINAGTAYSDAGATSSDAHSGLNGSVTSTGIVNSNVIGTYTITYNVSDKAGNVAATKTRTVTVVRGDYNLAKGVNYHVLATGMTPIKWNGTTWVNTTESDSDWYDYDLKQWANAKTADGSMWVWIPRYIYKISSGWHSNTTGTIDIQFSKGTNDNWNSVTIGNINTDTTANASNKKWTNHPAFTFGNDEVTGMWVAKFEAVYIGIQGIGFIPNGESHRSSDNSKNISQKFDMLRSLETNSKYGWGTSGNGIDTHLMKNTEWGAIAYLSKSVYGKDTVLIWINNSSTHITGCAGDSSSASSYGGCKNAYHTENGVKASSTGNIYGIYDLSGGASEYTAAYIDNGNSSLTENGKSIIDADSKYKNVYLKGSPDDQVNNYDLFINSKGDALYETSSGSRNQADSGYSWFLDYSDTPLTGAPWFHRGGHWNAGSGAGSFAFYKDSGYNGTMNGTGSITYRPVLLVKNGL